MAEESKESKTPGGADQPETGGSATPSPQRMSNAESISLLSFCIGVPMLAGSGLCIALFFPSIIIAGPLLLIGGLFTISGFTLKESARIGAYVPLMMALAATVAYLIWINLPHGGS